MVQVCREFLRGACKRAEAECRFAHPPPPVAAHDDGCVTVCMDAVKGRCVRDPCRYFHPPLHLQAHLKAQARGAVRQATGCTLASPLPLVCSRDAACVRACSVRLPRSSRATLPSHSRFTFNFLSIA